MSLTNSLYPQLWEAQNSEYAAWTISLSSRSAIKTARGRVAKQTTHKIGQFVTLGKDSKGINQPFNMISHQTC
jgi:hypothetical protein